MPLGTVLQVSDAHLEDDQTNLQTLPLTVLFFFCKDASSKFSSTEYLDKMSKGTYFGVPQ